MKCKNIIPVLALSLSLTGCTTLERLLLNSNPGKQAVLALRYKYTNNFGEQCRIEDFGLSNFSDNSSDKPILFFLYGWGGSLKEFLTEEKEEEISKLSLMKDVFDNRVILADYPSSIGMNEIFSGLENSFLEFVEAYSQNNSGKKPKLVIAGHSLGSQLTRMFVRKYPQYFEKAGLIAGMSNGLDLGMWTGLFKKEYKKYMEKILVGTEKSLTAENYQSIEDITTGSAFMSQINTPTEPLDVEYNFYIFVNGNSLLWGEGDGIASMKSAYPIDLIYQNKFEKVHLGDKIVFKGEVTHNSVDNFEIFERILKSLKSDEPHSVEEVIVPKCSSYEERLRKKEESLLKGISLY